MKTVLRYFILLVLLSVFFLLVVDKIIMPIYVGHSKGRYLPDVRGIPFEEATERLELEGFVPLKGEYKYTSKYAYNTVIDQYPRPMQKVKLNRRIRLTLAQPEKMVVVPDIIGKSLRSAKLEIKQVGLAVDTVLMEYDIEVPYEVIKWQYPRAGDYLKKGSGITLIMSRGKPPTFFQVPQLFGLSLNEGKKLLEEANLQVGSITYRQNVDLMPYTILEQSIEAGVILDRPAALDLTFSILDLNDIHNELINP